MSKQVEYRGPAPEEAREIGLTIKCDNCETMRTYQISKNLALVLANEEQNALGIAVNCEECGHIIGVDIGHIDGRAGYSYQGIAVTKDTITVQDDIGLKPAIERNEEDPWYWQHKMKCMACSLHFIVCSDYEEWPFKGTTREQQIGEATGLIHCPECGSTSTKLHYVQRVRGFIFQAVPGMAQEMSFHRETEKM